MGVFGKAKFDKALDRLEELSHSSRAMARQLYSEFSKKYDFIANVNEYDWVFYTQVAAVAISIQDSAKIFGTRDNERLKLAVVHGMANTEEYGQQPLEWMEDFMNKYVSNFGQLRPQSTSHERALRELHAGIWILRNALYVEQRSGTSLEQDPDIEHKAAKELGRALWNSFGTWFSA